MLTKKVKTILIAQVLILWLILATAEIISLFFLNPKPMVWRAWEVASNYDGKDHNIAPFKPLFVYSGPMSGDLLNTLNFKPKEIREQLFEVDEYGYRNRVGLLNNPVEAVLPGNSFIGGAQETQEDLVSDLLTYKYNIPTYNYATFNVNDFWHDTRFLKNTPKFLIVLGTEGDLINGRQNYEITNAPIRTPKKWDSYEDWQKNNDITFSSFSTISQYLKNFSFIRYIANKINTEIINFNRSRSEVAQYTNNKMVAYDAQQDMIFFQPEYNDPRLGSSGKSKDDIDKAIKSLKETQQIIKERGIILIVATMPSKPHLHAKQYINIPTEETALFKFEQELDKNNIENIKLLKPTKKYIEKTKKPLYYPDDTHWNKQANLIISEALAKKIQELKVKYDIY